MKFVLSKYVNDKENFYLKCLKYDDDLKEIEIDDYANDTLNEQDYEYFIVETTNYSNYNFKYENIIQEVKKINNYINKKKEELEYNIILYKKNNFSSISSCEDYSLFKNDSDIEKNDSDIEDYSNEDYILNMKEDLLNYYLSLKKRLDIIKNYLQEFIFEENNFKYYYLEDKYKILKKGNLVELGLIDKEEYKSKIYLKGMKKIINTYNDQEKNINIGLLLNEELKKIN
jgi:hypothetical protein